MKSSVYLSVCTKGIQADGILSEVPRTVSSHSIITVNISSCFQVELQVEAWFVVRSIQRGIDTLLSAYIPAVFPGDGGETGGACRSAQFPASVVGAVFYFQLCTISVVGEVTHRHFPEDVVPEAYILR